MAVTLLGGSVPGGGVVGASTTTTGLLVKYMVVPFSYVMLELVLMVIAVVGGGACECVNESL